jgi:hypothetical protein
MVHAAAKTTDFLKVFAKYIAIETDVAANLCDTCLPRIQRSQIVAKSFATEPRVLFADE